MRQPMRGVINLNGAVMSLSGNKRRRGISEIKALPAPRRSMGG